MLDTPRDNALLRFSIGNELLKAGDLAAAIPHLRSATEKDPAYSAAWKMLGRALEQSGDAEGALAAWHAGIAAAEAKGDKQAGKEMTVFARRLQKSLPGEAK